MNFIPLIFVPLLFVKSTLAFLKQGIWENVQFPQDKGYMLFTKSMYKDTIVSLKIDCSSDTYAEIKIDWLLRYTPCAQEFQSLEGSKVEFAAVDRMMVEGPHQLLFTDFNYDAIEFIRDSSVVLCEGTSIFLETKTKEKPMVEKLTKPEPKEKSTESSADNPDSKDTTYKPFRRKREDSETAKNLSSKSEPSETGEPAKSLTSSKPIDSTVTPNGLLSVKQDKEVDHPSVAKVWKSGYYAFVVRITAVKDEKFHAKLTVTMKGKVGYISAVDWPRLIFYGVIGLVYIIYGLVWFVLMALNRRELRGIQYLIGGVIVLGMLEKAIVYAIYQNIANNGKSVTEGTVIFAEIVSSLKRALARMLVIIVGVGLGIVKPRLGPTFYKLLFVGGLYFILSTIEGCMRTLKPQGDQSTDLMLAEVPLAVIDIFLCCWLFSSLIKTTRLLRLRGNVVKLALFRHFTITIIVAVLASVTFLIWSVIEIKMKSCLRAWREIWLDEAFWHLLFTIVLAVIMILWRPSSNKQSRYTFSLLIDSTEDDEEEKNEPVLNDAFADIEKRSNQANESPNQKQNSNIPSILSDKEQTLSESDEKIKIVEYEMSKMQH